MRLFQRLIHFALLFLGLLSAPTLVAQEDLLPAAVVQVIPQVQEGMAVDKQVLSKLKEHLSSQVSFVQCAIELSEEQREKLASFNDEWLVSEYRKTANKKPKAQNLGNAIVQAFGGGVAFAPQMHGQVDPATKACISNIDRSVNELLTAEQQEQIKQERKAKDDFQAQALAEYTVVLIERQIHLSEKQAQELTPALTGKINKNCGWHVYLSNPQFVPTIPKAALTGILNDEQVRFIRGLNQQDFQGNDFGLFGMIGLDEGMEQ